ncbi:MAG: alanine--tRNA ligase [Legionellales bacterium RIFCSPHIGHO2_12_FULL_37_14]|nr:MAG: alanine--tRNA ligase [Legionellales bacterium RIFCSPHIGHO2_12_FULL_37_14]
MKTADIRAQFINYFYELGHEIVPSSSLVPAQDQTLLFTNAGMVQFKDVFLGIENRSYTKAATVQRCVRAGGKHNDLENVGYTARHHTFFEMLGFFSFGEYFKREAIKYAWDFLTKVLHLSPEKLWITVFKDDTEAESIWLNEIGIDKSRFSKCDEKDNFWAMGDTGPCGPCTEIFYDHGNEVAGGPPGSKDQEGDRYIEIWNLVFMQYNRDKDGKLNPLPKPAVDTGMGLERLAAVVQGVHSNYDIDDFQFLIKAILKQGAKVDKQHASVKVVADHLRSCAFLIADGVHPTNEGRGYVLRRIIRRAVRHGHFIGLKSPFLRDLVPYLVEIMQEAYPILSLKEEEIKQVLTAEEEQFARTLETGLSLLEDAIAKAKDNILDGATAFKLYDTYGFPFDLTQDILREKGLKVSQKDFDKCMQMQRKQSKASAQFSRQETLAIDETPTSFKGYETVSHKGQIKAIYIGHTKANSISQGEEGVIILDTTPFYAESGGQVGDTGSLVAKESEFEVHDTKRQGDIIMHYGVLAKGSLTEGQTITANVCNARRQAIRANHTATHLLHAALKKILGDKVEQKGSLVEDLRARFDFSYPKALTSMQLEEVENLVNSEIRANTYVCTQVMPFEKAKLAGAIALFGEKYSNEVRVLSIRDFSKELCGGTHVTQTGDIGYFKITAEYGIASGVRRIEFVTANTAVNWVLASLSQFSELADLLKTTRSEVKSKVLALLHDMKNKDKELLSLQQKQASFAATSLLQKAQNINGISFLLAEITGVDMQGLRVTLDSLKNNIDNAVIVLYTKDAVRMNLVVFVSKNLSSNINAATLAKSICEKSGGRPDMAQGGGDIPADLDLRLKKLAQIVNEHTRG